MGLREPIPGVTLAPEDGLAVCIPWGGKYKGQIGVTRVKFWGVGGYWHLGCYKLVTQPEGGVQ